MARRFSLPTPFCRRLVIVALGLVALGGMLGIVIDWRDLQLRKASLQRTAPAAAMAGARRLNGRPSGLYAALDSARQRADAEQGDTAETVVSFGTLADGPWSDLAGALTNPRAIRYVRVDLAATGQARRIAWLFPQLNARPLSASASGMAVAAGGDAADAAPPPSAAARRP